MDFRILGPLEALDDGRPLALGGGKQRALLGVLLVHANEALSTDRLIDELWGERPPANAAKNVQVRISRLRKALGDGSDGVLVTRERGYEVQLDPERIDAHRLERLVAEGRSELAAGRPERAMSALEAALSLWRGAPLADLAYEAFAQGEIARLEDLRVAALEQLNDAKLALGRHAEVLGELEAQIGEHPYRERLRSQLMLALYRCDRQADALQAYQDARRALVEELGIEPGERLRELERAILAQDPALAATAVEAAEVPASRLPVLPNRTVGRDKDLEAVSELASGALLGRESEVARIERILARLDQGHEEVVEISGEPGIGKTALLQSVIERSRQRGHRVLTGRGADFERDVPFGLIIDALDDDLRALDEGWLDRSCGPLVPELAAVFPAIAHLRAAEHRGLQEERYRVHRAVRRLLACLARETPLVLALDDVHWSDPASIELLLHLVRRPAAAPTLIVLALRSAQVPDALAAALESREREGAGERIALGPLPPAALDELLGEGLHGSRREHVIAESGGNPFYATALARALARGEQSAPGPPPGASEDAVPTQVMRAIAAELAALPDRARWAVRAAAVTGDRTFVPTVAAAAGIDELEVADGLEAAASAGLIQLAVTGELAFRHPIVRRAAYESAPSVWRRIAHSRAAAALEAAGAPVATWAHHLERSAIAGDEHAVGALTAGAEAAAPHAPATAARWYGAALRLLPANSAAERRVQLLGPLAAALAATGDLVPSRAALHELLDLLGPDAVDARARVVGSIALVEHMLGHHHAATALLQAALAALPDQTSPEGAELTYQLAWDHSYRSEYVQMARHARSAHAVAQKLADPALKAATTALLALAEYNIGDIGAAQAAFREAHSDVAALSDHALANRLDAVVLLAWAAHGLECFDAGLAELERGLAVSRATGQGHFYVPMVLGTATIRATLGELPVAMGLIDDAEEVALLTRNQQSLTWALTLRTWIATMTGDLALAQRSGQRAIAAGETVSEHYYSLLGRCFVAATWLEDGQPDRCVDALLTACQGPELRPIKRPFRAHIYELLTRADLARGRAAQAADWACRAAEAVADVPIGGHRAEALRAQAAVALARDRPSEAATLAAAAAQAAEAAGRAVDAARGRLLTGTALAATGARADAVEQFERGFEGFRACGAHRLEDAAADGLRGLGAHPPRGHRPARPPGQNSAESPGPAARAS